MKKLSVLILIILFLQTTASQQSNFDGCTIGVAHGSVTQDGRAMAWKSRDYDPNDMRVKYDTSCDYSFIYVYSTVYPLYSTSGLNEHGLSIFKSDIYDLEGAPTGPTSGDVQRHALGYCCTIDEFQAYLDSTNITGRQATGNFAMIDSTGAAVIFEVGGYEYWKFDAADSPDGYVIRTNFTINGGGNSGMSRYHRSQDLVSAFYSGDSLNPGSLIRYQMRDFSDIDSQPYPVPFLDQLGSGIPYGYFPTNYSICRHISTSASLIHGVLPGEEPEMSTMWVLLGPAAAAIAVPYWPVGELPFVARGTITAPLCDIAITIKDILFHSMAPSFINSLKLRDTLGGGLWTCTFPAEDHILDSTEIILNQWRMLDSIPVNEMLELENDLAEMAYYTLESCYTLVGIEHHTEKNGFTLYPNPASNTVSINLESHFIATSIEIIDIQGRAVWHKELTNNSFSISVSELPKGLYFVRINTDEGVDVEKLVVQ